MMMLETRKGPIWLAAAFILILVCNTPGFSVSNATGWAVEKVAGHLTIKRGKSQIAARVGQVLHLGDILVTAEDATAEFRLDGHRIKMASDTTVKLDEYIPAKRFYRLFLWLGRLWLNVRKGLKNIDFRVETPAAVAGVRGTLFTVAVDAKGVTWVGVAEGRVAVSRPDGSGTVDLSPGYATVVEPGKAPEKPKKYKQEDFDGKNDKNKGKKNGDPGNNGNSNGGKGPGGGKPE